MRRDRRGHRAPMTATCPGCGKVRYLTRAEAKKAARQRNQRCRVYRCGGFWHLTSFRGLADVAYWRGDPDG